MNYKITYHLFVWMALAHSNIFTLDNQNILNKDLQEPSFLSFQKHNRFMAIFDNLCKFHQKNKYRGNINTTEHETCIQNFHQFNSQYNHPEELLSTSEKNELELLFATYINRIGNNSSSQASITRARKEHQDKLNLLLNKKRNELVHEFADRYVECKQLAESLPTQ